MSVHLKQQYQENIFLNSLVEDFNSFFDKKKRKKILDKNFLNGILEKDKIGNEFQEKTIQNFDSKIGSIKFEMLDFRNSDYIDNLKLFLNLQRFLYNIRTEFKMKYNIKEKEIVLGKQKRIVSPDEKAYEMMGNNSLDIEENKENSYKAIFE
jgi:hypothetical protein